MTFFAALLTAFIVFLLSATLVLFIIGPTLLLKPRRRTADFYLQLGRPVSPSDVGLSYEEINVIVDTDIKLNSWLIRAGGPSPRGTIIYLHGVADCKIDGIRFAKLMHDNSYNVFLYDSRGHGNSGGSYCTYGYYEKHDVIRVIDYLLERTDIRPGSFGLFGTSMGAAVALQAAAIDRRISAVVSENSFSTLRTIFDDYQRRMIKLPFHYLRNMVIVRSEFEANFKASEVSPVDAVRQIHIPLLFIYGTDDRRINYRYSILLHKDANDPKDILAIEGASHTDIWDVAGEKYERKLTDFFRKNL